MAEPTKAAAKKAAVKKTTAKKAATTKTAAKKTTATTKTTTKKTTATKTTAKKPAATTSARPKRASVAAAAERAGGERARRHRTPLLPEVDAPRPVGATVGVEPEVVPAPDTAQRPALRIVEESESIPDGPVSGGTAVVPGAAQLAQLGLLAGQLASRLAGEEGEDLEDRLAELAGYLRRRISGRYEVDEFGFDENFTTHAYFPLLRLLYRHWFRVEVRGIENIPADSGALIVSNHSGTVAIDSLMTQLAVHDETPNHRFLRMLGADLVFRTPVLSDVARKTGATLATNPDATRLLSGGHLVGVWPEGFKGVGKPFSERYKLQRFGRGGFVAAALRAGVPIVPCSVVGAEEAYPMIGNLKTVARIAGLPYAPVTPTFPLLGPLGMIPLPSKWIIEFGEPVDTASLGPAAADDPMLVFDLTDQVRETIQQTLYSLLMARRSVFF